MKDNQLTLIRETFENGETGQLTPAVTVIIDGVIKQGLDIIMFRKNYTDYPEALGDAIIEGITSLIKNGSSAFEIEKNL